MHPVCQSSYTCCTFSWLPSATNLHLPVTPQQNTLDRKRKAGPLESVPEAKRGIAGSRPATTTRGGVVAADAKAPAPEETFEDIQERTGLSVTDILNRKLMFKKGTLPAKKLEEMGPIIKELKWVACACSGSRGVGLEQEG